MREKSLYYLRLEDVDGNFLEIDLPGNNFFEAALRAGAIADELETLVQVSFHSRLRPLQNA